MRAVPLLILTGVVSVLTACQSHLELQYTPERYARHRNIELLTTAPTRPFTLIAEVKGYGGRHTSTQTKINALIDEAQKAGAQALIPVENADRGKTVRGLDVFVFTEENRTVTRGRAVRWDDTGSK